MSLTLLFSPNGIVYRFHERQSLVPFETAFAIFCIYSSLVSIINFGIIPNAFNAVLGTVFTTLSSGLFLASGLAIYVGIGLSKREIEAFGVIVLISCILMRVVIITLIVGFDATTFNNIVFNGIFIIACGVRLNTLFKKHIIIRLDDAPEKIQIEYAKSSSITRY